MGNDISENVIYLYYYKTKSLQKYIFGVVGETHAHDYFEVISFYNSKDIYSPICHSPCTKSYV